MDLQTLLESGALSIEQLTAHINELPVVPTRIGEMNLFGEQGIDSTIAMIGLSNDKLTLVPAVPRGAPSQVKSIGPKTAKPFIVPHLPQRSSVMADSLQGARVFGTEGTEVEAAAAKVQALNVVHRRDIDFTIEYHRLGAIKGLILDADGTTLFDLYSEFGVSQQTEAMVLGTDTTKVKAKVLSAKRKVESALGGVRVSRYHAFVGSDFMDKLITHPSVEKAYDRWLDGQALRSDNRRSGFEFADVVWEEYEGSYDGTALVGASEGYLFPVGVPDMFITRFAPADYIETVNTIGLPYYSKTQPMDFNKGIQLESQSNPLNLNTRPRAVVKLTTN